MFVRRQLDRADNTDAKCAGQEQVHHQLYWWAWSQSNFGQIYRNCNPSWVVVQRSSHTWLTWEVHWPNVTNVNRAVSVCVCTVTSRSSRQLSALVSLFCFSSMHFVLPHLLLSLSASFAFIYDSPVSWYLQVTTLVPFSSPSSSSTNSWYLDSNYFWLALWRKLKLKLTSKLISLPIWSLSGVVSAFRTFSFFSFFLFSKLSKQWWTINDFFWLTTLRALSLRPSTNWC